MNLIRACRFACGLSQIDLARILGTSRNSISAWESDEQTPTALMCFKLGYIFSMDPALFMNPCHRLMFDEFRMTRIPFVVKLDINGLADM